MHCWEAQPNGRGASHLKCCFSDKGVLLSDFFKWLIVGWSIVVVGISALGMILIVKYGEVKKIETDDVSLCFIIAFFCWLIPIIAFTILARTLGF